MCEICKSVSCRRGCPMEELEELEELVGVEELEELAALEDLRFEEEQNRKWGVK